jgi:hypothetical protein
MGTGGSFPGGKARPGRDADHSPPSSAEVKNERELYLPPSQTPPWRVAGQYKQTTEGNDEACGSKKVSFRRTKQTSFCHITRNLIRAPSEVARENEKHHENVAGAGNIDSSARGNSAHLSQSKPHCMQEKDVIACAYV